MVGHDIPPHVFPPHRRHPRLFYRASVFLSALSCCCCTRCVVEGEENPIISTGRSIIYFALKIIRKLFSIHRTGGKDGWWWAVGDGDAGGSFLRLNVG